MTRLQLLLLTLIKLVINISLRAVYPFAPALARGLDITTLQLADLIALRNFSGIFSPLFGSLSERHGRRSVIVAATLIFAFASISIGVWPLVGVFTAMLILTALAKVIFDPATYGLIGDLVPYHRRGRFTGFIELSWAGGMFVGAPLTGLLLGLYGWTIPFVFLGGFAFFGSVFLWYLLPAGRPMIRSGSDTQTATWLIIRQNPIIWAVVIFVFTSALAVELILINFGVWLEANYSSEIGAVGQVIFSSRLAFLGGLGLVTTIIGLGEGFGDLFILFFSDRIGKRRLVLICGILSGLVVLSLTLFSESFAWAMIVVLAMFFLFEVTFVTGLPLFIERLPQAKAVMHAMVLAGIAIGRLIGASAGSRIWAAGGLNTISVISAVIIWLGMGFFYFFIEEAVPAQSNRVN